MKRLKVAYPSYKMSGGRSHGRPEEVHHCCTCLGPHPKPHRVAEVEVQAIAELVDAGSDLIEPHRHCAAIALDDIHGGACFCGRA